MQYIITQHKQHDVYLTVLKYFITKQWNLADSQVRAIVLTNLPRCAEVIPLEEST